MSRPRNDERDDIDPLVVDLLCEGARIGSTAAEREEAVHRLAQRGLTTAPIADRIGVTDRTVQRIRQRLGLTS